MSLSSALYRLLRSANDGRAVSRAVSSGSLRPVGLRLGRKAVGRASGRVMGKWLR